MSKKPKRDNMTSARAAAIVAGLAAWHRDCGLHSEADALLALADILKAGGDRDLSKILTIMAEVSPRIG